MYVTPIFWAIISTAKSKNTNIKIQLKLNDEWIEVINIFDNKNYFDFLQRKKIKSKDSYQFEAKKWFVLRALTFV